MKKAMLLVLFGPDGKPRASGSGFVGIAVVCLCLLFAVGTPAQQQKMAGIAGRSPVITSFDAPGASKGSFQGTFPGSINTVGDITGSYEDASSVVHGFVRNKKGIITSFDAPDAGTGSGQGTVAVSINTAGDITGNYYDASNVSHGFVRTP